MATQKNGPLGGWKGKLGNAIGYFDKSGNQIIRSRSKKRSKEKLSNKEKENWLRTEIINTFLNPVSNFVKLSFDLEGKLNNNDNGHNMASRANRKAIVGEYPNLYIDFNQVLFSKGVMPAVYIPTVAVSGNNLIFSWNTACTQGMLPTDQVVLMAYLPQINKAFYLRSGAKRSKGTEMLDLVESSKKLLLEVYISFIAEDHSSISNSTYLGQFEYGGE